MKVKEHVVEAEAELGNSAFLINNDRCYIFPPGLALFTRKLAHLQVGAIVVDIGSCSAAGNKHATDPKTCGAVSIDRTPVATALRFCHAGSPHGVVRGGHTRKMLQKSWFRITNGKILFKAKKYLH